MYIRNCPQCGEELSYKTKGSFTKAINKNWSCRSCAQPKDAKHSYYWKNKTFSEEHRRNISISRGGSGTILQFCQNRLITWSKQVRERDEYVCQHCHYDGLPHEMDAHHIVPKAKFPRYAYDLDNGITLCRECHIYQHKHYRSNHG